jgi:hypothetical protein
VTRPSPCLHGGGGGVRGTHKAYLSNEQISRPAELLLISGHLLSFQLTAVDDVWDTRRTYIGLEILPTFSLSHIISKIGTVGRGSDTRCGDF